MGCLDQTRHHPINANRATWPEGDVAQTGHFVARPLAGQAGGRTPRGPRVSAAIPRPALLSAPPLGRGEDASHVGERR
jgi:hypothetical protein